MTLEIALVFAILTLAIILLITEIIPLEITALLTLGAVALTGLVPAPEALSGFANPAVVTIWAVFIISGGLTRTGVAQVIGNFVLRIAGSTESTMILVIMTTAGLMSAIMNNVAVAALMLPVVMDIAHRTNRHPARLLMPLAYGCLLGGLTTEIGTPPNILVTAALEHAGLKPFGFFDFTPIGMLIMVSGTLFMAYIGRHLLPNNTQPSSKNPSHHKWFDQYELTKRLFELKLTSNSHLAKQTLAQIRIGSIMGWNVISIHRTGGKIIAPSPELILQPNDLLIAEGQVESLSAVKEVAHLVQQAEKLAIGAIYGQNNQLTELKIPATSAWQGKNLDILNFRQEYGLNVLAIRRHDEIFRVGLADVILQENDWLLLSGPDENLQNLAADREISQFQAINTAKATDKFQIPAHLRVITIAADSKFCAKSLKENKLSNILDSQLVAIKRQNDEIFLPETGLIIQPGDQLIIAPEQKAMATLAALTTLTITPKTQADPNEIISAKFTLAEAILSPHTTLAGKSLRRLNFRKKFGLQVLAIWHKGQSYRSALRDMKLSRGDALLLLGPKEKLRLFAKEDDFIILTELAREEMRHDKMPLALLILFLVLLPVIIGWVPIYIAVVMGAAVMVIAGCLTMEEAYRQIEWKAVFLIAGMLPLGTALDSSGAAKLIAQGVVALVGPYGPNGVMFGLIVMTFMLTCFVPTAALVVIMAPIVFSTSTSMGLSPHGLLMAVGMAASASFMTPVSHPANTLIMGPGGYRFSDYFKIGGLLTLVTLIVLMLALPILWPLKP